MKATFVFCPRCGEFLGDITDLIECPLCNYNLKRGYNTIEDEQDES